MDMRSFNNSLNAPLEISVMRSITTLLVHTLKQDKGMMQCFSTSFNCIDQCSLNTILKNLISKKNQKGFGVNLS